MSEDRQLLVDAAHESAVREAWAAHGFPESNPELEGLEGRGSVTLFVSCVAAGQEVAPSTLHRLLLADVISRYLRLSGRALRGRLSVERPSEVAGGSLDPELDHLGIWFGRNGRVKAVDPQLREGRDRVLDRIAEAHLLHAQPEPHRFCPGCAENRGPQRVRYREEPGRAYLLRIPIAGTDPPVSALLWTEAVWKLLGMTALLVNPELPYVRVEYRRRGFSEQILLVKAALPRLAEWLPGGEITVLEEEPGSAWAGQAYLSPLRSAAPVLAALAPPSGVLHATAEVNDSGTGIISLVPGHGPSDAALGRTLGVTAPEVILSTGLLCDVPRHKYSGLPLDTAEACILRDLLDDNIVLAELKVRRGVPRCSVCNTATIWRSGTAWCLDVAALPRAIKDALATLLPDEPAGWTSAPFTWPISDGVPSENPADPELRECAACGRVSPRGATVCACGERDPPLSRRHLLLVMEEPICSWIRARPLPPSGAAWFVLPASRQGPALAHQLIAAWATGPLPAELRVFPVPTLPATGSSEALVAPVSPDAIRLAFVRLSRPSSFRETFADAVAREARWLERMSSMAQLLLRADSQSTSVSSAPIGTQLGELLPEDLALLARFERVRSDVLGAYSRGEWTEAYRHLSVLLEREFGEGYLQLVRARMSGRAPPAHRAAISRLFQYVFPLLGELGAPLAPFVSDALFASLRGRGRSVFEGHFTPVQEPLLDPAAEDSLATWQGLGAALGRGRKRLGMLPGEPFPRIVIVPNRDEVGARLLPQGPVLARLLAANRVEVFSSARPWRERQVRARFDREAIRAMYPGSYRRILSWLDQLDGRRVQEAQQTRTLSVVLDGQATLPIPASMVEITESLPEGMVSVPWTGGELFAELPARARASGQVLAIHLPASIVRVSEHLRWRRRAGTPAGAPPGGKAFIFAPHPFRADLLRFQAVIAERGGVAGLMVVDSDGLFNPDETSYGRTSRGEAWRVWLPGVRVPHRRAAKTRRREREDEVRIAAAPALGKGGPDILDETEVERQKALESLREALEAKVGGSLLGPAKLREAWAAGYRSIESFAQADPIELSKVRGFGPVVGWEVIQKLSPERPLPPLPPLIVPQVERGPTESGATPVSLPAPQIASSAPPFGMPPELAPAPAYSPPPVALVPPPSFSTPRLEATMPKPVLPTSMRPAAPVSTSRIAQGGVEFGAGIAAEAIWDRFLARTREGSAGLWVGRLFPSQLRTADADADLRFLWLSSLDRPNSVPPSNLALLASSILQSMVASPAVTAVILQEVEYLSILNGGEAVATLLRELDEQARAVGATVWVPLNTQLLPPASRSILEELQKEFAARH